MLPAPAPKALAARTLTMGEAGAFATTLNASVNSTSPASIAVDSPKALWQLGLPRRRSSLSMQQIIMDQRIAVQHLDRRRKLLGCFSAAVEHIAHGQNQHRADAFAAAHAGCNGSPGKTSDSSGKKVSQAFSSA